MRLAQPFELHLMLQQNTKIGGLHCHALALWTTSQRTTPVADRPSLISYCFQLNLFRNHSPRFELNSLRRKAYAPAL